MKNLQELENIGYVVFEGNIEQTTYGNYLSDYGQDLTTTPKGLSNREHIRKVEGENGTEWQIWTWGVMGNNPRYLNESFETEEEAELCLYEYMEYYAQNSNCNAPTFWNTIEEAEEELKQLLEN